MSTPSAPSAPDPAATAAAQTASNKATAITSYGLNATNQVTPQGNLTYSQIGTWDDGTPRYQATTTYSPEQQNLYDLNTQMQSNLGNIGVEQSDKVRGILNTPFDLNSSINNQQADIWSKMYDPVWDRRQQQYEADLVNKGFSIGDEGYTNAMKDFNLQRDDAYNSALLASRSQAATEALGQRNQPLNEISALMSGSQVSQPSFGSTPQSNVANTDVAGIYNNAYQNQLSAYNTQMQNTNAMYGALGSMAGSLGGWGMMKFSDRRLKEDIKPVGKLDNGLTVYSYRLMKGPYELGLMADEVEKLKPDAVLNFNGFKMVDYRAAVEG